MILLGGLLGFSSSFEIDEGLPESEVELIRLEVAQTETEVRVVERRS